MGLRKWHFSGPRNCSVLPEQEKAHLICEELGEWWRAFPDWQFAVQDSFLMNL
jgi:hypothetical protein